MTRNILIINWQDITNPLGGGAEVHLHEIFKRICKKGHQVTLLCCQYPGAKSKEIIDGIKIIRNGSRNLFNYIVPQTYFKFVKERRIDIVIDDINKIPFYTPLFVRKPLIGIIHHLFGNSIFIEAPLPAALYVNFAERLIPLLYRKIPMAVVSDSTKQELVQKGFYEPHIHFVNNGVDTSIYKNLKINRNPSPMIGYLGRIKKYKSVDHLLYAFKIVVEKIPNAQLLIIGDGDYLSSLKKMAHSLQLDDAVQFTGTATESQKLEYLNRVWFTVNPSPKEGWGLTVIESNACGVPVIAADSPGLRDSVVHEKTGLLYPYGDYFKLAEMMIKMIEQNQLRNELSSNSITWANQFSWDNSAKKMMQLIEQTLSERSRSATFY